MFLKRVFYASASVLMLALAFYFGAVTAAAQAGNPVVDVCLNDGTQTPVAALANGDWYEWTGASWEFRSNVFGASPAGRTLVALDGTLGTGGKLFALASNGEVFALIRDVTPWPFTSLGIPGSGTPTQTQSWGATKRAYRVQRGAVAAPAGR